MKLIRYNVQSMYMGGPVSWEYQADANGEWLPADTTLDYIRELERKNEQLRRVVKLAAEYGKKQHRGYRPMLVLEANRALEGK